MRDTPPAAIVLAAIGAVCLAVTDGRSASRDTVTVTIDPAVTYQTIRGWSCNAFYLEGAKEQREQVIDEAVNSLGITRLRWQEPNGNRCNMKRWEPENDDGDPDVTDMSKFNTRDVDTFVAGYLLPFKKRIEANGDPFELWLSPSFFDSGSTGSVPAFLLRSPGEYAEYATALIKYLREAHGIETTHYAICNEAGNNNAFGPAVVAEMTKVLGERMEKLGLPTRGQFSDGVNAHVTWNYIQAAKDDPEVWKYVDVLSYHWYGGKNQEAMAKIREFARVKGMITFQSEFMGLTMNHLYDDLTIGGVSYWCIYGLGGPGPGGLNFNFHLDNTSFDRGGQFWNYRQVMHYACPGAVRVEAVSDSPALRAVAFVNKGRTTVVLINNTPPAQPRSVTIRSLPPGRYGVCRCVSSRPYEELGVTTVSVTGALDITVPADCVLTVYPHPGKNLPPTVTDWRARPGFLKTPANRVKLCAAAQDPEQDRLSYSWAVTRQPPGAKVSIADQQSAVTEANGLSMAGQYAFTVTIRDGVGSVERVVLLNVYEGNQPPRLMDLQNRLPVEVTLPHGATELRSFALDLEGDKLAYHWSVVSQPSGSAVVLGSPTEPKCKVSNITRPGDHVFRLDVSDGTSTVAKDLTVHVYPEDSPPVIEAARADPAVLTLSTNTTFLRATTSDPDGDTISHWWRIKRAPTGAKISFAKQGGRDTKVEGFSVEGTYVFELTVVDRAKFVTKDVVVTVAGQTERPAREPTQPSADSLAADSGTRLIDPPEERSRDSREVVARGRTTGTVVGKGRAWVEIKSQSGKKARYIPKWIGGSPGEGGGPEARIVEAISKLREGDRVSVLWYVDNHVRIKEIEPMQ